eukprot:XP_015582044.1 uncharacterized protein LOC107262202 [Ricinus communis]
MENFLKSKEYWHVVETGVATPMDGEGLTNTQQKELEELKLKDLKAKNYLFQAIGRAIMETILHKETSKDIGDSMKKKYQSPSRTKRAQLQALRKEFEILQMKDDESVTSFFVKTMVMANKMCFHSEKMEDVVIVKKILRSMASKFNYVICSITDSKDADTLSLDELQSSLLIHEQNMNRDSFTEEQALTVSTSVSSSNSKGRGRGRGRGRGTSKGRGDQSNNNGSADQSQGRGRGRDQQFDKSKIKCF